MKKIGLGFRNSVLHVRKSRIIRLKRTKMFKAMLEKIKLIVVRAFGEVILVRKFNRNQLYG